MTDSQATPKRLLRWKQIPAYIPISRSAWYAGIRAGIYPQPVKLGEKCVAWWEHDVLAVLERIAQQGA